MRTEQDMYDLFIEIAEKDERIRAVYLHGSRANPSAVKDKYSDYDIVFVVTEVATFIDDKSWLDNFGEAAFIFEAYRNQNNFFANEINDLSRRHVWSMILVDGCRLDVVIEVVEEAMNHIHIKNKPTIILHDKDNCLVETPISQNKGTLIERPSAEKFTACCSGFWWFLNDVAKAIARDQLPYAKELFSTFNRLTLNHMIDWYIGTQNDFSVSPGNGVQCYKNYLPGELYDLYLKTYSDGEKENFWLAIFYACELFNKTAQYVGECFGYAYNKQEEESMMEYLLKVRDGEI